MLAALLIAFLFACLVRWVAVRCFPHGGWLAALLPGSLFLYFLWLSTQLSPTGTLTDSVWWIPALGVSVTLVLDGFSLLFALLITGIGTLVAIYAGAYFAHDKPADGARFLSLILLFMTAMLATVLADNLIVMFIFWEATSLLSFMLIGFKGERAAARKAALQSLLVTGGGGLALFGGILLLGIEFDTWSLREITAQGEQLAASALALPIMVLVLLGAFTKSAQFPFHFWLPNAMEAPGPASAFLHSATMVKLGVYLLARFDELFAGVPLFGNTLVVIGLLTMLIAATRAIVSDGYKEILAQSTVGSLGALVMLIGLDGDYSIAAMVTFILAHAFYKAALFFCAGTTLHATHEASLSRLGGLGRALPFTALAASLAAFSMAGLPPTLGFITKEYLFESQLHAEAGWLAVAVAVVVNAVFVAIAGLAALRPFFSRRVQAVAHHPETFGLWVAPLTLGVLGLLFGVAPFLVLWLLEPATSALLGRPVELTLALWHGFTPMLALSATVVALGVGLFTYWLHIREELLPHRHLDRFLGAAGYERLLADTLGLAARCTRYLQSGDQHRYSAWVVAAVVVMVGYGLFASDTMPVLPSPGEWHVPTALVLLLMVAGALAAVRTPSLLRAMLGVGVVGFGSALLFLMNGAPDVALTQFSVEVLIVLILAALLLRIPDWVVSTRSPQERRVSAALAMAVGVMVFAALITLVAQPLDRHISDFYAAASYPEAHGRNVVNVILVDFRALDTLGEVAVVAFAAISVWGLLRLRSRTERRPRP